MSISPEIRAKIIRYYHVESWTVGTISRELRVHHTTVKRALAHADAPYKTVSPRPSMIDPYLQFIYDTLERHPNLTASRLYDMVRARGYPGQPDHFRHLISIHRPRKYKEAFLRLKTLPGEQGQVDWADFGEVEVNHAKRRLAAFVMVLSYSRRPFVKFYYNQQQANFLDGHVSAFEDFGGVPRVVLYDNLKLAVLNRCGDVIQFHPTLLQMSAHYRFEARPVAVARGNEKGRVERLIQYVRSSFFAGRTWTNLENLNEQALVWCHENASDRPCPENLSTSVKEMYLKEKPLLIALPGDHFDCHDSVVVTSGKTPYIRYDGNDYSILHSHVRKKLVVVACQKTIKILDDGEVIAKHCRAYGKAQQIEDEQHIEALRKQKTHAKSSSQSNQVINFLENGEAFLTQAANKGYHIPTVLNEIKLLIDRYGTKPCDSAMLHCLKRGESHPNNLRLVLQEGVKSSGEKIPVGIAISDMAQKKSEPIKPHNILNYDNI